MRYFFCLFGLITLGGYGFGSMPTTWDTSLFKAKVLALMSAPPSKPQETLWQPPKLAVAPRFTEVNRRDPFQADTAIVFSFRPEKKRKQEPLEAYPLAQLRYVGTWILSGQKWALVMTPDQQVHSISVGAYLGKHEGKLVQIEVSRLVIEVVQLDDTGQQQKQKVILPLQKALEESADV